MYPIESQNQLPCTTDRSTYEKLELEPIMSEKLVEGSLNPPSRYAMVSAGIYRGGYPTLPNFRFLSRLQLKTVISLTPEAPSQDIKAFCEMAGATVIYHSVQRVAPLNESLVQALLPALMVSPLYHNIQSHC